MDDEDMSFLRDEKYNFDEDYYGKGLLAAGSRKTKNKKQFEEQDDYEDDFDV